jgi:uncharacterized protein
MALGVGLAGCSMVPSTTAKSRKVLFFSKSSGFEHAVIRRQGNEPSFAEKQLAEMGPRHGIEFTFSKDGSRFGPEYLAGFDALVFYTSGDLTTAGTDKQPPMSVAGKAALLEAVRKGTGFVGIHSATDTFRSPEAAGTDPGRYHNDGDRTDPYIRMVGAEFIIHGKEQQAVQRVMDGGFPGAAKENFEMMEEWYSFKNFATDLHVLLAQETKNMVGAPYWRPPYPSTWARRHAKGRVFYTSMGHREDVWRNPLFEQILFGGIAWATGNVPAKVAPNVGRVTPGYADLPPKAR